MEREGWWERLEPGWLIVGGIWLSCAWILSENWGEPRQEESEGFGFFCVCQSTTVSIGFPAGLSFESQSNSCSH